VFEAVIASRQSAPDGLPVPDSDAKPGSATHKGGTYGKHHRSGLEGRKENCQSIALCHCLHRLQETGSESHFAKTQRAARFERA